MSIEKFLSWNDIWERKEFVLLFHISSIWSGRIFYSWCITDLKIKDNKQYIIFPSLIHPFYFHFLFLLCVLLPYPSWVNAHSWLFPTPEYFPPRNVSHLWIFYSSEYLSPINVSHFWIFYSSEYLSPINISHFKYFTPPNILHPWIFPTAEYFELLNINISHLQIFWTAEYEYFPPPNILNCWIWIFPTAEYSHLNISNSILPLQPLLPHPGFTHDWIFWVSANVIFMQTSFLQHVTIPSMLIWNRERN